MSKIKPLEQHFVGVLDHRFLLRNLVSQAHRISSVLPFRWTIGCFCVSQLCAKCWDAQVKADSFYVECVSALNGDTSRLCHSSEAAQAVRNWSVLSLPGRSMRY